uniref:All-trans-retinol 13,14-reductase n=1 Tax=Poecilia latipinna TaxID=48699 RepID=A0A3B3V223_9TELE
MLTIVAFACVSLVIFLLKYVFGSSGPNPFEKDCREPLKEKVYDKKEKNKILKQGFVASKVPDNLDAVIIGSGVGGLGLAVLLAKVGKKVLVLEQHSRAGGCCHTFTEKGFEFDVGIHYIGDLMDHKPFRCMLDQMTNGQLQWEKLENPFDHVVLGPPENRRSYPIYSGSARYSEELKKRFPGEEKAIDEYLKLVKVGFCDKTGRGIWVMAVLKLCPLPLAKFLIHTGLVKHLSYFYKMAPRSLTDVVNELTENKDLRAVFTYIFGNIPKDASFAMHSLLTTHYLSGAWYPKAGSSEIFVVVFCLAEIQKQLSLVKHGAGGLSIFIGLNGTREELGLRANNYWIFADNNFDELYVFSINSFIFYSVLARDHQVPLGDGNPPSPGKLSSSVCFVLIGKSTLTVVSFANHSWFEEWKDGKVTNRGPDYKELKQAFIDSALNVLAFLVTQKRVVFLQIEYIDAGTPITNTHYIAAPKGEIYGVDHGIARFSPELNATIRPQTPLKNLYLTGQDVFLCGFAGALAGALTCGSVILNRNLHLDAIALAKKTKYMNNKLKDE